MNNFLHGSIANHVSPNDVSFYSSAVFRTHTRHPPVSPPRRVVCDQGDVPRRCICACLPLFAQVRMEDPLWWRCILNICPLMSYPMVIRPFDRTT